ncbi:MAG: methyltransferase domain-containing protein [Acidobacteriota bacterium]|nr:methyltransferase domain-containing protein [Acidobacteriota bacterium]
MNPAEFAKIRAVEETFWWYRGMRRIFDRVVDPLLAGRRVARVLEAGCGTGYVSSLMQRERGWKVASMDISAEGLRHARTLGVERPVQGDVCSLPFATGSFDVVLSLDVLPHLPSGDERGAIRELARVAAPGALVIIRAAALPLLRSRHSEYVFERQRFTRARLVDPMRAAGLRILRVTYANSLLLPVAFVKFRIWEPLTGAPLSSGVEAAPPWMDRLLHLPLALEAAWLGRGRNLALGQSLIAIGERTA